MRVVVLDLDPIDGAKNDGIRRHARVRIGYRDIDGATFDNLDHFANELFEYLIYCNNHGPHQALGGQTPKDFATTKTQPAQSAN